MRQIVPEIPALATSSPAAQRVGRFLAAIAPVDDERLAARVADILTEMPESTDPAGAVARAQERLDAWWKLAFDDVERGDPHARRALARLPDAFLSTRPGHLSSLRRLRRQFAEPAALTPQRLARSRMTAWARLLPMLLAGIGGATVFAHAVSAPPVLVLPWAALFGLLLALQVHSAVLALIGLFVRDGAVAEPGTAPLPPTAIVMPIYEEDPQQVFAALAAMREELLATGRAEHFAFYVLSDTQDALHAADEDRAWRRLAAMAGGKLPVYYRRRTANIGKKAGNVAEFAVRNVHRYTYAVILDADSVMGARTIVSMIERMEERPALGLLQSPIALRGGETLFARLLQLGHAIAGPLLFRGLGVWSGADGNYYGHNAVVRLRAFVDCCGLPTLQGSPPLGGPILSHDFVEAALLRRGGWEVRFARGDAESFEEPPPTIGDYLTRDRRWCQGNLQHLRVLFAEGLTFVSRLHLLFGALAYLASPLWLAFLVWGALVWATGGTAATSVAVPLTLATIGAVLLPRVLGWLDAIVARGRGVFGRIRLFFGCVLELAASTVLAPVMLIAQTSFVLEILLGGAIDWRAQRRKVGSTREPLDRRLTTFSSIGVVVGLVLVIFARPLAWALAPVWAPWAVALLMAQVFARRSRTRLLATDAEIDPPPILRAAEQLAGFFHADQTARFRDIVLDPVLNARRRGEILRRQIPSDPTLAALADKAIVRGPAALRPDERGRLLDDAVQLQRLHVRAWQEWPVESWNLPRPVHAEPPTLGPGQSTLPGVDEDPVPPALPP